MALRIGKSFKKYKGFIHSPKHLLSGIVAIEQKHISAQFPKCVVLRCEIKFEHVVERFGLVILSKSYSEFIYPY